MSDGLFEKIGNEEEEEKPQQDSPSKSQYAAALISSVLNQLIGGGLIGEAAKIGVSALNPQLGSKWDEFEQKNKKAIQIGDIIGMIGSLAIPIDRVGGIVGKGINKLASRVDNIADFIPFFKNKAVRNLSEEANKEIFDTALKFRNQQPSVNIFDNMMKNIGKETINSIPREALHIIDENQQGRKVDASDIPIELLQSGIAGAGFNKILNLIGKGSYKLGLNALKKQLALDDESIKPFIGNRKYEEQALLKDNISKFVRNLNDNANLKDNNNIKKEFDDSYNTFQNLKKDLYQNLDKITTTDIISKVKNKTANIVKKQEEAVKRTREFLSDAADVAKQNPEIDIKTQDSPINTSSDIKTQTPQDKMDELEYTKTTSKLSIEIDRLKNNKKNEIEKRSKLLSEKAKTKDLERIKILDNAIEKSNKEIDITNKNIQKRENTLDKLNRERPQTNNEETQPTQDKIEEVTPIETQPTQDKIEEVIPTKYDEEYKTYSDEYKKYNEDYKKSNEEINNLVKESEQISNEISMYDKAINELRTKDKLAKLKSESDPIRSEIKSIKKIKDELLSKAKDIDSQYKQIRNDILQIDTKREQALNQRDEFFNKRQELLNTIKEQQVLQTQELKQEVETPVPIQEPKEVKAVSKEAAKGKESTKQEKPVKEEDKLPSIATAESLNNVMTKIDNKEYQGDLKYGHTDFLKNIKESVKEVLNEKIKNLISKNPDFLKKINDKNSPIFLTKEAFENNMIDAVREAEALYNHAFMNIQKNTRDFGVINSLQDIKFLAIHKLLQNDNIKKALLDNESIINTPAQKIVSLVGRIKGKEGLNEKDKEELLQSKNELIQKYKDIANEDEEQTELSNFLRDYIQKKFNRVVYSKSAIDSAARLIINEYPDFYNQLIQTQAKDYYKQALLNRKANEEKLYAIRKLSNISDNMMDIIKDTGKTKTIADNIISSIPFKRNLYDIIGYKDDQSKASSVIDSLDKLKEINGLKKYDKALSESEKNLISTILSRNSNKPIDTQAKFLKDRLSSFSDFVNNRNLLD